ncbi:MAG: trigger factor [Bacteroidales bacterium]|nr:trigger factor [Bacteroidales bacterium]
MKVEQVKINDLTYQLNVNIEKADAQDKKKKALNEYRRKAEIRGFRKGMAPMSLIEKMHGVQALVESVNQMISEAINNYIEENKLNILGEPLPNEEKQKSIDWENDESYEFVFDIALSPKVEFTLDSNDKIVSYNVKVSDEAKDAYKTNMLKQFGKLENIDEVKDEENFIVADLEQGETKIEGTYVTLRQMPDQAAKDQFLGKKVGDSFEVNVNETFTNETDRAALLKVKKEELAAVEPMWKVTVKEVKTFVPAEQTQEVYDRMFGEGVVTDEAGFEAKVVERIAQEYKQEADFRFVLDAREYLLNKTNIELPEEFMKKWLYTINEGKFTMEDIEKDFALFCKDFRWQMISQYIMREQKMEITREEVLAVAKQMAKYQFAMYGLNDVPEEQLNHYAESILANEKEGRRIVEKTEQDKVIGYVKSVVTLEEKEISIEDLQKMNN